MSKRIPLNGRYDDLNGGWEWLRDDLLHRDDGPAIEEEIIDEDGSKFWYKNGMYHREDGPAAEYADGGKFWYKNGMYHREDGPAFESSDGVVEWYLNGKSYGWGAKGFWALWNRLTEDQRKNPNLLKYKEEYGEHEEQINSNILKVYMKILLYIVCFFSAILMIITASCTAAIISYN